MATNPFRWLLLSALILMTSAAVVPSNTSTAVTSAGTFLLQPNDLPGMDLIPLTDKAAAGFDHPLSSSIFVTNSDTIKNLTNQYIAYISCDESDYPGNLDAEGILQQAIEVNASAFVLYSRVSPYCAYNNSPSSVQSFLLFSMTNATVSSNLLEKAQQIPSPQQMYFAAIKYTDPNSGATNGTGSNDQNGGNNPLGPSPSTAVAMIILYSITGIITALFLVIIITGAIRAHRHPDRYGPRDVLGRPRQSRARGLGRAILDTLPIVKFGEREPPKPADVELGANPGSRTANDANSEDSQHQDGQERSGSIEQAGDAPVTVEQDNGISPALALAPGAALAAGTTSSDEGLGCSICTDDFERGQDIRVLPCNHKFHPECVDPWLLNVSGTCPLCRVDLRPVTSRTSSAEEAEMDENHLAPPLNEPQADVSRRRRSALRDILSLRSRPDASTEERIAALRRLRENQGQHGDGASGELSGASSEDVSAVRRSRRISARLHDVFSVRTRRNGADAPVVAPGVTGESTTSVNETTEQGAAEDRRPNPSTGV